MKFGEYEVDIDKDDLILEENSTYQIVTWRMGNAWDTIYPTISKPLFKQLQASNAVYTNDELKTKAVTAYGNNSKCTFWKFNMEKINAMNIK